MTTLELIEKGIGHNCLSDAYDLGRADKYQEITSEYMLLTEKQVAEIRADAIEEFANKIKEYSGEHYLDCDGYGCQKELVFRTEEFLNDIVEELKEQNK